MAFQSCLAKKYHQHMLPLDGAISPQNGLPLLYLNGKPMYCNHVFKQWKVSLAFFCHFHLQMNTEQRAARCCAVELRARTSSLNQDGVNLNRHQDGIISTHITAGNLWLTILNGEQWLRQTSDLAVTLSGVCLCALWTTFLYHLLWHTIPRGVIL